jgi:hypothetical protein
MPAATNRGPAPIDVVLDLRCRPLQPRSRSCLLDGKLRACRADTIHPLESQQVACGINHGDCRGRIALLRALSALLAAPSGRRLGRGSLTLMVCALADRQKAAANIPVLIQVSSW